MTLELLFVIDNPLHGTTADIKDITPQNCAWMILYQEMTPEADFLNTSGLCGLLLHG